jgi:glycosyltransferase involved in cell wall biosynthesis
LPWRNHFPFFSKLFQIILKYSLNRAIKKSGFSDPIVWSFLHNTALLKNRLSENVFIYHCVDDWSRLMPLAGMGRAEQILKDEKTLAEKADLIFTTAAILKERLIQYNPKTYYIPNAVDTSLFAKAKLPETKIPLDIASIPGPIIGFVGSLEKWVNLEWLIEIFSSKTDWAFISIGVVGSGREVQTLANLPNVHLLGLKPKESLPGYLKKTDVAIIPFKISELGKSISPLKLFEYFAAGKPVVASDLPEISRYGELVKPAKSAGEFIRGIEEALKEKENQTYLKKLEKAAEENSWSKRIEAYARYIWDNNENY